ncbi:CHAP domain-containing protein [Candidatus Saccharibacteria bacterium]|nr:MAG: CHAP domain-containing protein [Candidatus Saccharibacteria bacterium]
MEQNVNLRYYVHRYLFTGLVLIASVILISLLISTTGAHTVLDRRSPSYAAATSINTYDSPNAVSTGAYNMVYYAKVITISIGSAMFDISQSVNALTVQTGKNIAHFGLVTTQNIWNGTRWVVGRIGNGISSTLSIPGKLIGTGGRGGVVSALVKPSGEAPVLVIDSKTSAAVLDNLKAQQRQEIAKLLADQLVANRGITGVELSGDPSHGGYPSKWENAVQDSLIDNWGMYNRECVSYAAWKVFQTYGHMPYWGGVGNANQWLRNAKNAGIPTGSTPKVGSVAISMSGYYGHAMWVEAVRDNMIYISQYNYDLNGHYSEMWVDGNKFSYIYFN